MKKAEIKSIVAKILIDEQLLNSHSLNEKVDQSNLHLQLEIRKLEMQERIELEKLKIEREKIELERKQENRSQISEYSRLPYYDRFDAAKISDPGFLRKL